MLDNKIPAFTKEGQKVMKSMVKNIGTKHALNAITDYAKVIDLNKDGKLDDKEIGLLKTAIKKDGSIDKQKLEKNIDEYKSKNIITISSPLGNNGRRDIVQFQGYTDINEYQDNKLRRIIGVSENSISITQYGADGTSNTSTLPKTPENIEKYLKGIDLA